MNFIDFLSFLYRVKFSSDAHCLEWSGLLQDSSHPPKLLTDFFAFCFHAWCFSEKGDGKQAPGMDFLKPGESSYIVTFSSILCDIVW